MIDRPDKSDDHRLKPVGRRKPASGRAQKDVARKSPQEHSDVTSKNQHQSRKRNQRAADQPVNSRLSIEPRKGLKRKVFRRLGLALDDDSAD